MGRIHFGPRCRNQRGPQRAVARWGSGSVVNLVLVEPEIPQNCGNIARTAVVTGCRLHLVEPLGFDVSDAAVKKNMRRCGLDYWPRLDVTVYHDLDDFFQRAQPRELWLATTKGGVRYDKAKYVDGCWLLFGKESAGLPEALRMRYPQRCVRIPMMEGERSLNLSNSVAVLAYEALRQMDFPNLQYSGEMSEQINLERS